MNNLPMEVLKTVLLQVEKEIINCQQILKSTNQQYNDFKVFQDKCEIESLVQIRLINDLNQLKQKYIEELSIISKDIFINNEAKNE